MSPKIGMEAIRRKQILDATFNCLIKKGYHGVTMQDVADESKVSKGLLHYYFQSKENLFLEMLDVVVQEFIEGVKEDLDPLNDPKEKLKRVIRHFIKTIDDYREVCTALMYYWGQINTQEEIKKRLKNHYSMYRKIITAILNEGIVQGDFKKINVNHFSAIISGVVDGLFLQKILDEALFDVEKMIETIEDLTESFVYAHN